MAAGLVSQTQHLRADPFGVGLVACQGVFDGLLHTLDGMLGQQLQHADVLPCPCRRAVPSLQRLTQPGKRLGQFPLA